MAEEATEHSLRLVARNTFFGLRQRPSPPLSPRARSWDASDLSTRGSQESRDPTRRLETRQTEAPDAGELGDSDQGVDSPVPLERGRQEFWLTEPAEAVELHQAAQAFDAEDDIATSRHRVRKCVPCIASVAGKECRLGADCPYCHLPHGDNMDREQRPSRAMRSKCKRSITDCVEASKAYQKNILDELQNLVVGEPAYARNYIVSLLRDEQWFEPGTAAAGASSSSAGPATATSALP